MEIILKKKTVNRSKPATKKKPKQRQKYWPEDFVGKPRSLADIIEEKCNGSGWYDEEYEAGKHW